MSVLSGLILEEKLNFSTGQTKLSDIRVSVVRGYAVADQVAEVNGTCVVQALPSFISIH